MKTEIVEQDGLFILRNKKSGEELDVYETMEEAEANQVDAEDYCE